MTLPLDVNNNLNTCGNNELWRGSQHVHTRAVT